MKFKTLISWGQDLSPLLPDTKHVRMHTHTEFFKFFLNMDGGQSPNCA